MKTSGLIQEIQYSSKSNSGERTENNGEKANIKETNKKMSQS